MEDSFTLVAVRGDSDDDMEVRIAAPTGGHLTTGTFATTAQWGTADVLMAIDNCSVDVGTITIHEVGRDPATNVITVFAATYTRSCGLQKPAKGEIRYNSAIGYKVVSVDQAERYWSQQQVGEDSDVFSVTMTAWGSEPSTIGTPTIAGAEAYAFRIVEDTCSGAVLAYGQTCLVSVIAHPSKLMGSHGHLVIPDDGTPGEHKILLSVTVRDYGQGTYAPIRPARILDTRSGNGAPKAKVAPGATVELQVLGRGEVPASGVSAVVLNLTAIAPTQNGFLTAYPSGVTRPNASSLNFRGYETRANSVTVQVGANGKVAIYNSTGSVHILADVSGWYRGDTPSLYPLGQLQPTVPRRLLDTRTDGGGALPGGYYQVIPVSYGTYTDHIRALVVNITAVSPKDPGYLTAWNGDPNDRPNASTLNYARGSVTPNLAVVPVLPCYVCTGSWYGKPSIGIYTQKTTHLLVDIVGFYDDGTQPDGLRFTPRTPLRIVDTRTQVGLPGAVGPSATATAVTPDEVIEHAGTEALAVNFTGTSPTAGTYLKIWPSGISGIGQPNVSNLNLVAGQTAANAAVTLIGPTNAFSVFNRYGSTGVVVDVVGTFWRYEGTASTPVTGVAGVGAGTTNLRDVTLIGPTSFRQIL